MTWWVLLVASAAFYIAGHVCLWSATRRLKAAMAARREAVSQLQLARMHRRWAAEDLKRAVELHG